MDITNTTAAYNYATSRHATRPESDGSTIGDFAQSFSDIVSRGEDTAQQAMMGNADPHALVQALAQTELAVETVVAVRNKVIEAYQEILRMPI